MESGGILVLQVLLSLLFAIIINVVFVKPETKKLLIPPALAKAKSTLTSKFSTILTALTGDYDDYVGATPTCNICGPEGYSYTFWLTLVVMLSQIHELSFSYSGAQLKSKFIEEFPSLIQLMIDATEGMGMPGESVAIADFTANPLSETNFSAGFLGSVTLSAMADKLIKCGITGTEITGGCTPTVWMSYLPTDCQVIV